MSDPYIFVSHSSDDNDAVAEIVDDLEAREINLWVDIDDLKSGQWLKKIQTAIDECAGFLVVISATSRKADWVMRECLYAMQLKKPIFIALIDDVPLPLLLVDYQFVKLASTIEAYEEGIVHLADLLRQAVDNPPEQTQPQTFPDEVKVNADENNFFAYLETMENGKAIATVARDLYHWAQSVVDETEFRGRFRPALHARQIVGTKSVSVFSILAYLHNPAVQIPFDYLRKYPPFTTKASRKKLLNQLEALLPKDQGFAPDRIDRRPAIPLDYLLGDADRLEQFKEIVSDIVRQLGD